MTKRVVATVVRKERLGSLESEVRARAYWAGRTAAERIAEVEALRRMWIERTGDPMFRS